MRKYLRFSFGEMIYYGEVFEDRIKSLKSSIFDESNVYGPEFRREEIKILAPVFPSKVIGIGLNYRSAAAAKGVELPREPVFF
ncbi:MAG: hypothetical protein QHH10_03715 [Peptococcaceae bacterium]|nr:DUF2437 domain-containing protein [Peptococcaceae bacterium]MDH7524406.1 hypothetical protein [Peptococcaceae bacterium]